MIDTRPSHEEKIAFASKKEAEAAAVVSKHQYGSPKGRGLKAYRCRQCDLWHLASDYESEDGSD
jgi:hypothetical protein